MGHFIYRLTNTKPHHTPPLASEMAPKYTMTKGAANYTARDYDLMKWTVGAKFDLNSFISTGDDTAIEQTQAKIDKLKVSIAQIEAGDEAHPLVRLRRQALDVERTVKMVRRLYGLPESLDQSRLSTMGNGSR